MIIVILLGTIHHVNLIDLCKFQIEHEIFIYLLRLLFPYVFVKCFGLYLFIGSAMKMTSDGHIKSYSYNISLCVGRQIFIINVEIKVKK